MVLYYSLTRTTLDSVARMFMNKQSQWLTITEADSQRDAQLSTIFIFTFAYTEKSSSYQGMPIVRKRLTKKELQRQTAYRKYRQTLTALGLHTGGRQSQWYIYCIFPKASKRLTKADRFKGTQTYGQTVPASDIHKGRQSQRAYEARGWLGSATARSLVNNGYINRL